jgi:hypothetical protein
VGSFAFPATGLWSPEIPTVPLATFGTNTVSYSFPQNAFSEIAMIKLNILASTTIRYPDPEAHESGCLSEESDLSGSDPIAGYVNLFCPCHRYTEPKIFNNGTDIAWPAGWTQDQAMKWRDANGVIQPGASIA